MSVAVVSVNVGRPAALGVRRGAEVHSAIAKRPVEAPVLGLGVVNLEGDDQADRRVHGGPDKALYVAVAEHLAAWADELELPDVFVPGSIGENLTVTGHDEAEVCIGDVWAWGEALVQVCQPRTPCYKLAMRTGVPGLLRAFEQRGWCGWYLRVLREGTVPTAAPLALAVVTSDPARLAVRRVQQLARGGGDADQVRAALEHPALAEEWRGHLRRRLVSSAAR